MRQYELFVKRILPYFSILAWIVFFYPKETFIWLGIIGWWLLVLVLYIRPIHTIFPKNRLFSFLVKLRREIGILTGFFSVAHGIGAIMYLMWVFWTSSLIELFSNPFIWDVRGYSIYAVISQIISFTLLITSNAFSTKLLGIHWKRLHRLSYAMFLFVAIHIYIISGTLFSLIIFGGWLMLFIIAYFKRKKHLLNNSNAPKWLCVPCGYIYDETIGDPDSGIPPGTRFEDIPEDWKCPVCGVGKSDFILLDKKMEKKEAKIVEIQYLTPDVIELKVETKQEEVSVPGQYMTFIFSDTEGEFYRNYSIASKQGNTYTFLIKIKKEGRAGKIFPKLQAKNDIFYTRISGNFILRDNKNPKVFIATGTGLSAIFSMLLATPDSIEKKLYFWVATQKDLFYLEKFSQFKNIAVSIFLSKEKIDGYSYGRIDLGRENFEKNSEFYICGNPGLIKDTTQTLENRGYSNVFSEEF